MSNPRNKTKIALIIPVKVPLASWNGWCDGLYAAFLELSKTYNVKVFGYAEHPATLKKGDMYIQLTHHISSLTYWLTSFEPEYIFAYGTATDNWTELRGRKAKKILLYAGGAYDNENAQAVFDQVIVELPSDTANFKGSFAAFGTNTQIYKPLYLNKVFPAVYPANFTQHKRHDLWASSVPPGSVAIGDAKDGDYQVCIDNFHIVLPQVPGNVLPHLYNQAHGVLLTADRLGDGQKVALEAMACNVPVLATEDNRASEIEGVWVAPADNFNLGQAFVQMALSFENDSVNLREEFVMGKLDEITYAKNLEKVL